VNDSKSFRRTAKAEKENNMSKITAAPDLPDTLKNALPPIQPLADRGRNALPALGGPPLKNEYSEAPYKNAVTSFADAVTKD
jgi:hypothetical protein